MSLHCFPVRFLVVKHWSLTWTLCEALWGHLKELDSQLDEPSEYIQILERRRAFSRWLSNTASPQIEEEVSLTRKDNPMEAVFSYLTGKRISEACSLAQQSGRTYSPLHFCLLPIHCLYPLIVGLPFFPNLNIKYKLPSKISGFSKIGRDCAFWFSFYNFKS